MSTKTVHTKLSDQHAAGVSVRQHYFANEHFCGAVIAKVFKASLASKRTLQPCSFIGYQVKGEYHAPLAYFFGIDCLECQGCENLDDSFGENSAFRAFTERAP